MNDDDVKVIAAHTLSRSDHTSLFTNVHEKQILEIIHDTQEDCVLENLVKA